MQDATTTCGRLRRSSTRQALCGTAQLEVINPIDRDNTVRSKLLLNCYLQTGSNQKLLAAAQSVSHVHPDEVDFLHLTGIALLRNGIPEQGAATESWTCLSVVSSITAVGRQSFVAQRPSSARTVSRSLSRVAHRSCITTMATLRLRKLDTSLPSVRKKASHTESLRLT